jgi:N-acetylglucosaminyldiphosphoundecaprenol N-acetyl-beta-D-mannosaminyltransferase
LDVILRKVSQKILQNYSGSQKVVFYGDFNVLNQIYENNIILKKDIIVYPDSTAVYLLLNIQGTSLNKIVSTDLQNDLLFNAIAHRKNIYFFGDSEEVLTKLSSLLWDKYNCRCHTYPGYNYCHEDVIIDINNVKPDILFVGLGAGKQEKWVIENHICLNVPLILTVGGWFCYLAGIKKRAPFWIRKLHFEWLYKLILEFHRVWRRYLIGAPLFFYRVVTRKIRLELKDEVVII